MRVLQVHTRYRQAGGEDTVVDQEHRQLRAAGHRVDRYIVHNPEGTGETLGALARSAWNPTTARRLRRVVDETRPDVAHVHNTWFAASPSAIQALSRRGVPVVVTLHNYRLLCINAYLSRDGRPCEDCVGHSLWRGVVHRCYRDSAGLSAVAAGATTTHRVLGTWRDHVDAMIVLNTFARDLFVRGGLPPGTLTVRSHATADPGPRPAPPSRSRVVVYVGRVDASKGVDTLVDAWSAADLDLDLVVIGDGPLLESLRARAPRRVRLLGRLPRTDVTDWLLRARAMAFPSVLYEGQPMVILEALAAGLPVLASDLGASPEVLGPIDGRLLVPPGDHRAWSSALASLTDDDLVDRVGGLARRTYDEHFTEDAATRALVDVYTAAISRRRAAADPVRTAR